MKSLFKATCLTIILAGCVSQPVLLRPVPMGATYIGPAYAMPGPGYVWQRHPQFGWGWHHPSYGWHRGWR